MTVNTGELDELLVVASVCVNTDVKLGDSVYIVVLVIEGDRECVTELLDVSVEEGVKLELIEELLDEV